ncbi:tRNA (adenosine(37)-N6)-threonylcarbamoyltransferase complex dimerization subunit type 1 TsaB [Thalassomonas sp. M1454]|uniref:tRNA (adenosine(37)-N6)-threonylcarbamoyltransferase complex dimerization subunit type 1 TsaB n=1 Tax=Thalassomonas sp. M1454 TaxID=2594477 RepID=UPI00117F0D84|nr:tRNA (adenosine(37)-N6)-threonylcarbamoyltransferase complex dimerization subunit type 1 TsaB [Thalassomonas sp. M1454]TRX57129.1 tRNA (adenosine(37)-N6)-threonylcarbamoyltransferase complex dimerization subunit type 1 TsaB [Thalassomonas sp. M1454]
MNYLAIDASTEACSVALEVAGQVYSRYEFSPQSHSLLLLPMVDEVLKEAGIKLAQLDGLIYGRGPGSFTGVRIGIGVAQGLAYSADLKVVGVSTLQAMAQQAFNKSGASQVIAAIDARMSESYCGLFALNDEQIMQPQKDEAVLSPSVVHDYITSTTDAALVGVGSAWNAYQEQLANTQKQVSVDADVLFPDAVAMLAIGKAEFAQGNALAPENAEPVYLRDTVTWQKLPGRE